MVFDMMKSFFRVLRLCILWTMVTSLFSFLICGILAVFKMENMITVWMSEDRSGIFGLSLVIGFVVSIISAIFYESGNGDVHQI